MKDLTLVIPAKFESESLPLVLTEIKNLKCKKLIVLEESDLDTINAAKKFDCELLFQKGKGYGAALKEGINKVNTKYFCIFNADGSFDPNSLIYMLKNCEKEYDFTFSSRYTKNGGTEDDTLLTFVGNKIFTFIGNFFFNLNIDDILFTYVMGKTSSFKRLKLIFSDFRFCVELPVVANRQFMKYTNLPSYERKRLKGKKKVNEFKDGFLILLALIFLFFKR